MPNATRLVLTALAGIVPASPALAAGLPQLDASTYASQVVWLVVTFVALYLLMGRIALPRIGEVLEARQNRIEDNLARAEDLRTQAEAAAKAYEDGLATARAEAFDAIRAVKNQAARQATRRQGEVGAELAARIQQAEAGIAEAQAEAISGIRDVAREVVALAVQKLVGDSVSDDTVASAVDGAIKARG